MITIYLLKNCPACKSINNYVQKYPNPKICIIYIPNIEYGNLNKFPICIRGLPNNITGLPDKNTKKIYGSDKILNILKKNTVNSVLKKNTVNSNSVNSVLKNINIKKSCFGKVCNTRLIRPYGPTDNKNLLFNIKYDKNKLKPNKNKLKPNKNKLKPKKTKCKIKCNKKKTNCKMKCNKKILTTPLGIEIYID